MTYTFKIKLVNGNTATIVKTGCDEGEDVPLLLAPIRDDGVVEVVVETD